MNAVQKLALIFTRQDKLRGTVLLLALFVGAAFEAGGVGLIVPFIKIIDDPAVVLAMPAAQPVLTALGIEQSQELLFAAGFVMIVYFILKSAYLTFVNHQLFSFVFDKQSSLSRQLLKTYLLAPYTFHLQRNSARLVKNTVETSQRFAAGFMASLVTTLAEVLVAIALIALLFVLAPAATLSIVLLLGVCGALLYRFVRRRLTRLGQVREDSLASMIQWINQALGGIKETIVLDRSSYFLDRHARFIGQFAGASRTFMFLQQLPRFFIESVAAIGLVIVAMVVLAKGEELRSVLPLLGLFAVAAVRLIPSANRIVTGLSGLRFHFAAVDVIYKELLEARESQSKGVEQAPTFGAGERLPFERSIRVENVSYRYPLMDESVLSEISLEISKGDFVAFVGPTGSGKTTLVDLILGLLTPTDGRISVDGRDIGSNMAAWRRNLGYVPQNLYLCDDTLRRNVAFALPDDEIDDARVWSALRLAQLEDLVRSQPEGLDIRVGEHGVRLSGGERQRLGIARTLYRDPEVLVLDEATASVDGETQEAIIKSLETLRGRMTVIIIAHRLAMVRNCDRVFLMADGRIADSGSYAELLVDNQGFRQLVEMVQ